MKKQLHLGFTLVELLVVISIIGMLAGLLLPAVQSARESGRKAVCISNQSQVALALLNYDATRNALPALRKQIATAGSGNGSTEVVAGWVGLLLPYTEQSAAWDRYSDWYNTNTASQDALYALTLPTFKCKSSGIGGTKISYVVNGGYQNAFGAWASLGNPDDDTVSDPMHDPGRKEDAPFIDYLTDSGVGGTAPRDKGPTVSIDYISSHDGTTTTILSSENLDTLEWIVQNGAVPTSHGEAGIAFCYPVNDLFTGSATWKAAGGSLVYAATITTSPAPGSCTYSSPDDDTNAHASWKGYDNLVTNNSTYTPVFINVARTNNGNLNQYSKARPSSNHPGVVIAAFADRGARPLSENISKKVFVQLCQPASGAIIDQAGIE